MTVDIFGPTVFGTLQATAHTVLSGHRVVMPRPEDSEVEYADASDLRYLNGSLWMTMGAAIAGAEVEVLAYGEAVEPTWAWTPTAPIWLSANGILTQTVPTVGTALFARRVGTAISPTSIFFDPQTPILLT